MCKYLKTYLQNASGASGPVVKNSGLLVHATVASTINTVLPVTAASTDSVDTAASVASASSNLRVVVSVDPAEAAASADSPPWSSASYRKTTWNFDKLKERSVESKVRLTGTDESVPDTSEADTSAKARTSHSDKPGQVVDTDDASTNANTSVRLAGTSTS